MAVSTAAKPASTQIVLQRIGRKRAIVRVVGETPLIINKFSEKAAQMMLDKQMGKAVQREAKDPEALFLAAQHVLREPGPDGQPRWGVPSVSFKAAIVGAARYFPGTKLTMTALKQMVLVGGEPSNDKRDRTLLVPIETTTGPVMRQDHVRNETGVADIRFRPEFDPWACTLEIVYLSTMLTPDSIVALVDAAGAGGVGEWRPASKESHTGMYGTFKVDDSFDVQVLDL